MVHMLWVSYISHVWDTGIINFASKNIITFRKVCKSFYMFSSYQSSNLPGKNGTLSHEWKYHEPILLSTSNYNRQRGRERERSFANFLPSISLLSFCVVHLSYFCLFPLWINFHLSFANLHIMHDVRDTDLLAAVLIAFSLSLSFRSSPSPEKQKHITYIFNLRTLW